MRTMAFIVALFGVLSFIFGIMAENKKPVGGIRVKKNGVLVCKYQSDPTILWGHVSMDPMVFWGYVSIGCLAASTLFGIYSLFYPYKGKHVPRNILLRNSGFHTFFVVSMATTGLAAALLISPTLTEQFHITNNIHHNLQNDCPTAKTGVIGGGSFVSLDASLLWLATLMLAGNAREDYLEEGGETNNNTENGSTVVVENA